MHSSNAERTQQERNIAHNLRSRLNALGLSDATHPTEPPPSVILIDETMMNTDDIGIRVHTLLSLKSHISLTLRVSKKKTNKKQNKETTNLPITHRLLHVNHIITLQRLLISPFHPLQFAPRKSPVLRWGGHAPLTSRANFFESLFARNSSSTLYAVASRPHQLVSDQFVFCYIQNAHSLFYL